MITESFTGIRVDTSTADVTIKESRDGKVKVVCDEREKEKHEVKVVDGVLDIKLKHLDEYIKARQYVAAYYEKAFAQTDKIVTPKTAPFTDHVYHQYVVVLKGLDRAKVMEHLQSKGIACAIYYPVALHMQKAYADPRYKKGDFPVCEYLCDHVRALPIHTEFTDEQLKYVTDAVLEMC